MEAPTDEGGGLEDRIRGLILANADDAPAGVAPGKAIKKRPNQAQRRQMAAELSIPIDTRPQPQYPVRLHPGHSGQHGQHANLAAQPPNHRDYGPRSADFQHSQPGPSMQNHPMNQTRHYQSSSADGGRALATVGNWRERPPQQQHQGPRGQGHPDHGRLYQPAKDRSEFQTRELTKWARAIVAEVEIGKNELEAKEKFRAALEQLCRSSIVKHELSQNGRQIPPQSIELKCFGSLASGFATRASDMDLALLSPYSTVQPDAPGSPIPRLLEKAILEMGVGARLLTRTRVPIIKICQHPPEKLRADLIEARLKWESGDPDDMDGQDEEQTDQLAAVADGEERQDQPSPVSKETRAPGIAGIQHSNQAVEEQAGKEQDSAKELAALRQADKKTFNSYCGMAKTVLRRMGGSDLNPSNASLYTADDYVKLHSVGVAFVTGLADEKLKERLFSHYSLSEAYVGSVGRHRTLAGILAQAEGEKLALSWKDRPIAEKDEHHEQMAQKAWISWDQLQNDKSFDVDPIAYGKELQTGLDRLKSIPSLSLVGFKQDQYESASSYHTRAIRLMIELGGADNPGPSNKVLPVIMDRYIAGIHNAELRSQVKEFAETQAPRTLRAIARRHKSLQLASDFQKALAKGFYQGRKEDVVRRYVECLRSPMVERSTSPDEYYDFVVEKTKAVGEEILPVIVRLLNPASLTQRDPYRDRLEFPKHGVGVQCDINFSAHLALHNTALLRCYSLTDPRVRPVVLFVKNWAKVRGINDPYRGTLSSYGYVLMVLHYLVNVAQPFVCPNLQLLLPPVDARLGPEAVADSMFCKGADIRFWKDEREIKRLASRNELNHNRDSIGHLLRGFFEYYAHNGNMSLYPRIRCFDWGRDTLSLRTHQGIRSKLEKGWTGAKTVTEVKHIAASPSLAPAAADDKMPVHGQHTTREVKEVRHRYLLAIEDPFELEHNVARTVTHNGVVAIRDEFRRAWRIIKTLGDSLEHEDLFQDALIAEEKKNRHLFSQLLLEIHGEAIPDGLGRA